ncbi:uncharacterized protein BDV17DRAFT_38619 [Aspergillus undulatus]|uniref:uncharacterized protein n=1 Tax=Aspergillus undulatus TaxID=1810928 RepID=UPI003CCD5FC4
MAFFVRIRSRTNEWVLGALFLLFCLLPTPSSLELKERCHATRGLGVSVAPARNSSQNSPMCRAGCDLDKCCTHLRREMVLSSVIVCFA